MRIGLLQIGFAVLMLGAPLPAHADAPTAEEVARVQEYYPELPWPDFIIPPDIAEVDPDSPNAQAVLLANNGQVAEALEKFLRLAEEGVTPAKVNAAVLLYRGRGANPDYVRAISLLEEAARDEDTFAYFMLGRLYYDGQAVDRSMAKASEYFTLARKGPAAPEAAWWLANTVSSLTSDEKVWIGHCLDAYSLGHRLAIESCQDSVFVLPDFVTPRVRQTEFATRLAPWHHGTAIAAQYVSELFSDNDRNFRQRMEEAAFGYKEYYSFDVTSLVPLIGQSNVRAADLAAGPKVKNQETLGETSEGVTAEEDSFAAMAVSDMRWEWSSFAGEEERSVIGCSDSQTDDSWLCLAARCDAPGEINLYIELTNLDVEDELDIVVGEQRFTVVGTSETNAPYSSRLDGETEEILAALKAGSEAVLDRPQHPFTPGYDTIPLRGSSRALGALEEACAAPAADQPIGATQDGLLPLDVGIYVREGTACENLTHATTLRYTGQHLNAQRVEGKITSVEADGSAYRVAISGHDIAEDQDIGEFEWTLTIPSPREFTLDAGSESGRYRWCFDKMPSGAAIS